MKINLLSEFSCSLLQKCTSNFNPISGSVLNSADTTISITPFSFCLCSFYFQLQRPDKAAEAAHTYFQANPEHVEMGRDLEQYKNLQGVEETHFVDREARPHQARHKTLISQTFQFIWVSCPDASS